MAKGRSCEGGLKKYASFRTWHVLPKTISYFLNAMEILRNMVENKLIIA